MYKILMYPQSYKKIKLQLTSAEWNKQRAQPNIYINNTMVALLYKQKLNNGASGTIFYISKTYEMLNYWNQVSRNSNIACGCCGYNLTERLTDFLSVVDTFTGNFIWLLWLLH